MHTRLSSLTSELVALLGGTLNDKKQVFDAFTQDLSVSRPSVPVGWIADCQILDSSWQRIKYTNLISKIRTPEKYSNLIYLIHLLSSSDDRMDGLAANLHDFRVRDEQAFDGYISPPDQGYDMQGEALEAFGSFLQLLHEDQDPSDDCILQELPYAFQGLKNDIFEWVEQSEGVSTALALPSGVPFPLMGLLNKILEPALLYRQLWKATSTDAKHGSSNNALLKQALNSAIQRELQSYLALIGVIENEVRRSAAALTTTGRMQFTIRRAYTLLFDATLGLRLMYTILQECQPLVGGQILSLLHGYTYSGDEFVARFAARLLNKCSKPFYEMMDHWLTSGTLIDPFKEFFIELANPSSEWKGRFVLINDKVPSYLGQKIANMAFETGKSLYFIRVACEDEDYIHERRTTWPSMVDLNENFDRMSKQLQAGHDEVVNRLNELLVSKFNLDLHLHGLKDYLLLTKGDFVQVLFEEAGPVLNLPSVQLFRHHLTSLLETAIRGSNAINDSEVVISCLDARMLEMGHGEIGWDLFTLDYLLSSPLDIVLLDRQSKRQYLKVFNFLWRLKRVMFSVYESWKIINSEIKQMRCKYGIVDADSWTSSSREACQIMMHFLSELQYYVTFEVVEMAWAKFQDKLGFGAANSTGRKLTVDEIIDAHTKFLATIAHKGLLGGEKGLMGDLHEVLKKALLFTQSVKEIQRLWRAPASYPDKESRLMKIAETQKSIKESFERRASMLVSKLLVESDNEMRFLGVRMDFNGYYSRKLAEMA